MSFTKQITNINPISRFLTPTKISFASHLYYVIELAKYSYLYHNAPLDLNGLVLSSELQKTYVYEYFLYALQEGWLTCDGLTVDSATTIVLNSKTIFDGVVTEADVTVVNPTPLMLYPVSFISKENNTWVLDCEGNSSLTVNQKSANNFLLNQNLSYQSIVSVIAYVAVHRVFVSPVQRLEIIPNEEAISHIDFLSYVLDLQDFTNDLAWVTYTLKPTLNSKYLQQYGFYAWYKKWEDVGSFKPYGFKHKLAYLKMLDIREGDICMLFERNATTSSAPRCGLKETRVVQIDKIDRKTGRIKFTYFSTLQSKTDKKRAFEQLTEAARELAPEHNFNFRTWTETLDLRDIGVENYLYNEAKFLMRLSECDGTAVTYIEKEPQQYEAIQLSQNDMIYWVLKDYDIKFNEERFRSKYFPVSTPAWVQYHK